MVRNHLAIGALILAGLSCGCVTRRYVITSDPPGAIVYRDGQPIGATPVEEPFTYYGKYRFRLVKDGYQPLDVTPTLATPWYQYPGVDFVAENMIPYTYRDVQPLHFQLQPMETMRQDDIRARAEELRARGSTIQAPPGTEEAPRIGKTKNAPPPAPRPTPGQEIPQGVAPPPGFVPNVPNLPAPNAAQPSAIPVNPTSSRGSNQETDLPKGVKGFPVSRSAEGSE